MKVDIAIAGGGPAGLAAAAALMKVLPSDVLLKVFEANQAYNASGAGVGLYINGMRALEAIHPCLAHRLYEAGNYSIGYHTYDEVTGQDNTQAYVPAKHDQHLGSTGHSGSLVYWNDIRLALKDYVSPDTIEFGFRLKECHRLPGDSPVAARHPGTSQQVEGRPEGSAEEGGESREQSQKAEQGQDSVQKQEGEEELPMSRQPYRFELTMQRSAAGGGPDETLVVQAKYVIGADGYFSRVRRQLGDGQTPTFSGVVCWRGSFTPEQIERAGVPTPAALSSPSRRAASHKWCATADAGAVITGRQAKRILLLYLADSGAGMGAWYMQAPVEEVTEAGVEFPPLATGHGGLTGEEALRRGLAVFAHLPADVRGLLAATQPSRVTEHGLYLHPLDWTQPGAWTDGHCVLLGDAAHAAPPDGQGACLALEDAVVLAECVRRHGGRFGPKALAEWEARRQPRVTAILSDAAPPFLTRLPLLLAGTFEQLWRPEELPVPAASHEEGLAWSREVIREIVGRKIARAKAAGSVPVPAAATAPAVHATEARPVGSEPAPAVAEGAAEARAVEAEPTPAAAGAPATALDAAASAAVEPRSEAPAAAAVAAAV